MNSNLKGTQCILKVYRKQITLNIITKFTMMKDYIWDTFSTAYVSYAWACFGPQL